MNEDDLGLFEWDDEMDQIMDETHPEIFDIEHSNQEIKRVSFEQSNLPLMEKYLLFREFMSVKSNIIDSFKPKIAYQGNYYHHLNKEKQNEKRRNSIVLAQLEQQKLLDKTRTMKHSGSSEKVREKRPREKSLTNRVYHSHQKHKPSDESIPLVVRYSK